MTRPKAQTGAELARQQARDIALLQRRGRGRDLGNSGALVTGLLDPSYRGPGPARVTIDGYPALSTDAYRWLAPYVPNGSREVAMLRVGGTWMISGHAQHDRYALDLEANWLSYAEKTNVAAWRRGFSERLPSGVVGLAGMVANIAAPAQHDLIMVLPEGHRPDERVYRGVNHSDTNEYIYIEPTGEVRVGTTGWLANAWVSLDGIVFMAAGVADWEYIGTLAGTGLVNGWGAIGVGLPRMWLDPYGFVWLEGQINGGTTTDGTVITALPAPYQSYKQHHIATATSAGYGMVGTDPAGTNLTVKSGSASTGLLLGGAMIVTAAARAGNAWHDVAYFSNGWSTYSAGGAFTIPSQLRRGDGLCVASGLIQTGTLTAMAFLVDPENGPAETMLMQTGATSARARIDVQGSESWEDSEAPRRFIPQQGTTTWFSLDTKTWLAG